MSLSDEYELKIGSLLLRSQPAFKPSAIAVSLHTSDPTDVTINAAASEVPNAGGYARVVVPQDDASWHVPANGDGVFRNAIPIEFPAPTANYGTVTHVGIWDSAAYGAGSLVASGRLSEPRIIRSGDAAANFPSTTLRVTVS